MFKKAPPKAYSQDVPEHSVDSPFSPLARERAQLAAAMQQVVAPTAAAENENDGVVVIGKGTKIVGEITHCSKLEIQGTVDGTIAADVLIIHEGGIVTGRLWAGRAVVLGQFNGQLEIATLLDVRSTGRVEGELIYGELSVAKGGHISGSVTNPSTTAAQTTVAAAPPAAHEYHHANAAE